MARRLSIRTQLLILVLGVSLPLLGLLAFLLYVNQREALDRAQIASLRLAQLVAADTQRLLLNADSLLQGLTQRPGVRAADLRRCDPIFQDFLSLHPEFANLILVDCLDRVLCAATLGAPGGIADVSLRDCFAQVRQTGKLALSRPIIGSLTGKWVVLLARPVRDSQGRWVATLGLPIDLARYRATLEKVGITSGVVITILDDHGMVVARTLDPPRWMGRDVRGHPIAGPVLTHREGTVQTRDLDGVERLFGFATVPGVGWKVFAGIPIRVALAPFEARSVRLGLFGLLALVLAAACALFVGSGISRPILALSEATSEAARGRLEIRAPVEGTKEVVEVASRFNQMQAARAAAEGERRRLVDRERSARAATEAAMQANAEVLGRVTDGFVSFDREWRYTYASEQAGRLLSRDPRELIGKHLWSEFRDLIGGRFHHACERAAREMLPVEVEDHSPHRDRWLESRIYPSPDGVTIFFRDVTERRRAEERLRRETLQAQLAAQTAKLGYWEWDVVTRTPYYSPEWKAQLGYSDDEINNRLEEWLGRIHPHDVERVRQYFEAYVRCPGSSPYELEFRMRHKDGSFRWMLARAGLLHDADGRPQRLIACHLDLSEVRQREEAEREMQARLRRAEMMSTMGSLVAGVAHEVRNPLFGISATVDALEARLGPHPEYTPYVEILREETRRLSRLMQDLIDYGRARVPQIEPAAALDLVSDAQQMCETLALERRVTIEKRVGAEPLPPVHVDRDRAVLAFRNLIENAVQHSPPGVSVVITCHALQVESRSWLVFEIRDRGPGFRAEDQPRLFDPFFSRRAGGTGLGLSIAKQVAEEHGGEIVAANHGEGGAVVTLRLPANPVPVTAAWAKPDRDRRRPSQEDA